MSFLFLFSHWLNSPRISVNAAPEQWLTVTYVSAAENAFNVPPFERGRAYVTFHIKYCYVKNKKDGKFIIIMMFVNDCCVICIRNDE